MKLRVMAALVPLSLALFLVGAAAPAGGSKASMPLESLDAYR